MMRHYVFKSSLTTEVSFVFRLRNFLLLRERFIEIPHIYSGHSYSSYFSTDSIGYKHPFLHYLHRSKGWNPRTPFDSAYLRNRPDVKNFERSSLVHFLRYNNTIHYPDLLSSPKSHTLGSPDDFYTLRFPSIAGFGKIVAVNLQISSCYSVGFTDLGALSEVSNLSLKIDTISHGILSCDEHPKNVVVKRDQGSLLIIFNEHKALNLDLRIFLGVLSVFCLQISESAAENEFSFGEDATAILDFEFISELARYQLDELNIQKTENLEIAQSFLGSLASEKPRAICIPYTHSRALNSPMRVLLVSHEDRQSGAPLYLAELAFHLMSLGWTVKVIVIDDSNAQGVFADRGIDFEPISRRLHEHNFPQVTHQNWLLSPDAEAVLTELVREFSPSAAILNSLASSDAQKIMSAEFVPSIIYVHEIWIKKYPLQGTLDPFLKAVQGALNSSNLVLFGSIASLNAWKPQIANSNLLALPTIRQYLSPNPIDREQIRTAFRAELGIPLNAKVVVAIGIFEPRKFIETIIQAVISLKHEDLHLVLVGKAGRFVAYESKLINLASQNKKILIHSVTKNLEPYYSIADIFVHASEEEVFTLVLQEAAAWHIPLVTSNYDGVYEIVGENHPYVFQVGDYKDAAKKILLAFSEMDKARNRSMKINKELFDSRSNNESLFSSQLRKLSQRKIFLNRGGD